MSAPKPRLLFLCHTLPFPLDGGVWLRTYNIIRLLSRDFEVRMLCFERTTPRQTPEEIAKGIEVLSEFGSIEVFRIPRHYSKARMIWDHLRSLFTRRPFTVYHYENPRYRAALERELAQNDFDLVHIDSLDLSGFLPLPAGLPVVCVHHNVESQLWRRRVETERGPKRWYVALQADLTEREEQAWCGRMALNVTVSEQDRDDLAALCPDAEFEVVPNGVDVEAFAYSHTGDERGVVFVGGLNWYPNRDALRYFAGEIAPRIRARHPDVVITWVGSSANAEDRRIAAAAGIDLPGRVPDILPIVGAARCYVVPLRVGGGTRLKVLDAWSMGRAVVSTSIGCEGLGAVSGTNALLADDPETFADAVCRVLDDDDLARRLGLAGRRTVETEYSWEVIHPSMIEAYNGCIVAREALHKSGGSPDPRFAWVPRSREGRSRNDDDA